MKYQTMNTTEEEIKKNKNAIIYDPTGGNETPNLPDVALLLSQVEEILDYMVKTEELKELKKDNSEYEKHMEDKFPFFSSRYFGIFRKLINGEDITPLLTMCKSINEIKSGNITMEQAEKQLGEGLAEKYIYPNLTKEQKKKIKDTLKNEPFLN